MSEISVVIPMYNSAGTVLQTLCALENQTRKDFEVIVVNDGSPDSSKELVEKYAENSKFPLTLISQKNLGPARARNSGALKATGRIIIFLDADCVPAENWIEEMVRPLCEDIAGCNCGYKVKNKGSKVARYVDYEIARRHERLKGKYVDTIGSYSASYLKAVFLESGGFDSSFPKASGEDFDLSFRIRKRGHKLFFTDKTFVYHYHPGSIREYIRQQYLRGYWRVELYLKNRDRIVRGDSYTGYEAQVQFVLSNIALLSIPFAFIWPLITLLCFGLLLLSNLSIGLWCARKERDFILYAPLVASSRSLAGTFGVYGYLMGKVLR